MGATTTAGTDGRSRRRLGRIALATLAFLIAALGVIWIERQPIVTHFIDRELARRGVPATYRIEDIGFGRQRLTHVVIGDPRHPDLVADRIETKLGLGLHGPYLIGVEAGQIRLDARLIDGRVSLGTLDRLLPAPSGKPFALPALRIAIDDARIRLATPAGQVALRIMGKGRLDDGFAGAIAARAPRLATGGCSVTNTTAAVAVRITRARPQLTGPVTAAQLDCDTLAVAAPRADLDVTLSAALDRWQGRARIATAAAAQGSANIAASAGTLDFAGTAAQTRGRIDATARRLAAAPITATAARIKGDYELGGAPRLTGRIHLGGTAVDPAPLARATALRTAAGTPVAPLLTRASAALAAAGRGFDVDAQLEVATDRIALSRIMVDAGSGARLTLGGEIGYANGAIAMPRALTLIGGGGGLPRFSVALSRPTGTAAIRGRAIMDPYAAGTARLALTPVVFTVGPTGAVDLTTRATLTGPLGDGAINDLTMSLALAWNGRDRLMLNPACTPLTFDRLAVAGLTLDPTRLTLCPTSGALFRITNGEIDGGARLAATRLTGRLGSTPLALSATGAALRFGDRGFAIDGVAARLGAPDRQSQLTATTLTGTLAGPTVTGRFAGAGGRIANVPLNLTAAAGDWVLNRDVLTLAAGLTVSDQAATPRFRPLGARDVAFRLAGGDIAATGTLLEPNTTTTVATVAIAHRLADGTGHADLAVPALAFREGFQPELLTPLTFGVIADVRGTVDGAARIAWSGQGVTSTGEFGTAAVDFAAAFGPVTGLATRVRFDDLLGLHSPPGQVATVRTVNPGIAVEDGTIRYQVLDNRRVQVEGARWPFAGGTLGLDPSRLDFSDTGERRLTFRVQAARADQFLQQFDFANLDATGVFDGVLPMIFDQRGGRIEQGRLAMREGGGTIAYVGALGQEQLGLWGDLAFQALKSLRYRSLGVTLNGPLAGEMVTDVRFAGISQGAGAKSNLLVRRLQRLPFVFNVRIKAPFRGLIDSAQSFYDPRRLIQRNLPALLEQQNRARASVQPSASEDQR